MSQIPALPELEGVDLAAVLESTLGCPVLLENDLNLAAWGLYLDRFSQETDHMACLYLGRGVGCGLVLGGRLFKGSSDFAGEVGSLRLGECALEEAFFQIRRQLSEGSGDRAALRRQLAELAAAAVNAIALRAGSGIGSSEVPVAGGGRPSHPGWRHSWGPPASPAAGRECRRGVPPGPSGSVQSFCTAFW